MTEIRFLADENLPIPSVIFLRKRGIDIASVVELMPGASDEAVLKTAIEQNRVVITFDKDFGDLVFHRKVGSPNGIIYFRLSPRSPEEPAEMLILLLQSDMHFVGYFTVVGPETVRQRSLTP